MKKYRFIWFMLIATLTISTVLQAKEFGHTANIDNEAPMDQHRIQSLDRKMGKHQTIKKDFRNQKEFLYRQRYQEQHKHRAILPFSSYTFKQRGYPYSKRGWELAYLYDRASFYDRFGYHYGYFNRHGFYFEGEFYRYDRWYSYYDRVKGKGIFGQQFYMPANYRYYGFDPMPYR
ncbi:hypothetical protein PGH07_11020 [Sulfurovum sp. zt1-1]|uniref:Uncharacterized protein n=1 Tax=Sulfurovum zhangzhouensis TaxID=3019067 RepID=A0ABT7R0T1_9BACT|nr:hypothetical protein [Sulfurovum zhangzhouensis]MDM5272704.1 hypothetical protein [Sulfurovum zhangzhouensis]